MASSIQMGGCQTDTSHAVAADISLVTRSRTSRSAEKCLQFAILLILVGAYELIFMPHLSHETPGMGMATAESDLQDPLEKNVTRTRKNSGGQSLTRSDIKRPSPVYVSDLSMRNKYNEYNGISLEYSREFFERFGFNEELYILSFSNKLNHNLVTLAQSSQYFANTTLTVLGLNSPCTGWRSCNHVKAIAVRNFIESVKIPDTSLFIFVDGWDVLVQGSKDRILYQYHFAEFKNNMTRPLIFNGQKRCWPWDKSEELIVIHNEVYKGPEICNGTKIEDGVFPYLNAGGYMGYGDVILNHIDNFEKTQELYHYLHSIEKSEQAIHTLSMLVFPETSIVIDQNADIFLSFRLHKNKYFSRGTCGLRYFKNGVPPSFTQTNSKPSVLHFHGPHAKIAYGEQCFEVFRTEMGSMEDNYFTDFDNRKAVKLKDAMKELEAAKITVSQDE